MKKALAGFERLRIDIKESPKDDERFEVDSIPLVVILAPDGRELARHVGFKTADEMLAILSGLKVR